MAESEQRPITSEPKATTPRPMVPPRSVTPSMTPREILAMVRRHWFMIVFLTIFGFGCGVASWYLLQKYRPEYRALTFIRVLSPVQQDPTMIQSNIVAKDVQFGYRMSMSALLLSQGMFQELLDRDKIQQTNWFKNLGNTKDERIREGLKDLKKHFDASPQRDGDFIVVSMTCQDKTESALITNEMVNLFISGQGGTKRKEVADKMAQLDEQQVRVQRDLDSAERELDSVRRRYGFTDLEEHAFEPSINIKMNDLETQQNQLMMDITQTRAAIESLVLQAQGPVQVQVERQVETDPVMTSLAQQLAFQESTLASALARFGEDHRIVRQIRKYIDSIQQERLKRKEAISEQTRQSNLKNAQDQLTTLEERLSVLEKMREDAAKRKQDMDLARVQYQQRVSIRDERKTMLDSIKEQSEKLKIIHDDPETPKVQFVAPAPEPLEASFPKWQIFLPGGTILGLFLGIGLAFLVELLNDLVRTPKDVAMYLRIPLLGIIPDAEEDEDLEDIELALVSREAPNSLISESYRRLRTNLKLSASAERAKTILITSGGAKDGKTTVAVNLAMTLVADGKKILLIDGNLRRPSLQNIFASSKSPGVQEQNTPTNAPGLSSLLTGQCTLQDAIRSSGTEWLEIIESGQIPANPAETLGGKAMEQLIKQERNNFDYVIIDGPPVLLVSETKILSKYVDGTIVVFNAAQSRRGTAIRTIVELRQVDAHIFGCVLLGVKMLKGGYFRELFKSYQDYQAVEPAKV